MTPAGMVDEYSHGSCLTAKVRFMERDGIDAQSLQVGLKLNKRGFAGDCNRNKKTAARSSKSGSSFMGGVHALNSLRQSRQVLSDDNVESWSFTLLGN